MATLRFSVASELKDYGYTEDGEKYIGEVYFILAEDENGNRYAHLYNFYGVSVHQTEDGPFFEDVRETAQQKAQQLLNKINCSKYPLNVQHSENWIETRPAYGSRAFIAYGQFDDIQAEKLAG